MTVPDVFPPEIRARLKRDHDYDDAYRIPAADLDVLVASYPGGSSVTPHRHHDMDIVGVVVEGAVRLTVDGDERTYGPGAWFHVPVSAEHAAVYESRTVEIEFMFKR
jgi:quercetin dioxygenase-like cupin family protein